MEINTMDKKIENIRPRYYNDSKISPFDVIDDWQLDFYAGSILKYLKRAGKKPGEYRLKDLRKVKTYIDKMIDLEVSNVK